MGEFLILLQKSYAYLRKHRYIFGMREAGRPLIEFDIFDVENYDAIIERIEAQETERE